MCLDQNRECREFAKWLLKISAGQGVNAEDEVTLPGVCVVEIIFSL